MLNTDSLHRFLFEELPFRGQLVHLDSSWRAVLEHSNYPDAVRDVVGESAVASVLLAATLKFQGHLSLQLRSDGPLSLLLAQCTDSFGIRALARHTSSLTARNLLELTGKGQLSVILDNQDEQQRYQGIVPLVGEKLAHCLEAYFAQSEQLPTRLWLHADGDRASGMLLQRLPAREGDDPAAIEDAWRRVQLIGDTLQTQELRDLSDREILHRLFNEDDLRLFEPSPVFFRCTCARDRVAGMLQSLGKDEVESVLAEQGQVEVRCDFCNRAYQFDAVDVTRLFATGSVAGDATRH